MIRRFSLILLITLGCLTPGQAAPSTLPEPIYHHPQSDTLRAQVYFPVGKSVIDLGFSDNAATLDSLVTRLDSIAVDPGRRITAVSIEAYASPEGSIALNRRLSSERAQALEDFLARHNCIPDSISISRSSGIAWDMLAQAVGESDMPHKEEAIGVILNTPELVYDSGGRITDSRMKQLMELQRGRSWFYMNEHFFPALRCAVAIAVTVQDVPVPAEEPAASILPPPSQNPEPEEPRLEPVEIEESPVGPVQTESFDTSGPVVPALRKPFSMALSTNLLSDIIAIPSIGAEFSLADKWSINTELMYSWWGGEASRICWRYYGGSLAVRRWFGHTAENKALSGHHIGIAASIFTYDFMWNGRGQMGGQPQGTLWDAPNWSAGIEYGYSLPIARKLNLDFSITLGYLGGQYHEYIPADGHAVWQGTYLRRYLGPTMAEVSLVWLLGKDNVNPGKGGRR